MKNKLSTSTLSPSWGGVASSQPAFSLVEIVMLIAALGVLCTITVTMLGGQTSAVKETKLTSDITSINHMVSAYLADGGTLTGLTNPQAVLDKMKRIRPQADWQMHTGASSGRLIDTRLRARVTTTVPDDGAPRARWDSRKQRFELSSAPGTAVTEFFLDENLRNTDFGSDTTRRTSRVKYNRTKGWVWGDVASTSGISYNGPGGSNGNGMDDPFDPDEDVPVTPPPDDGGDDDDDDDNGGGGGGGVDPPTATPLPRPVITPAGRTFPYAEFPATVTISPNGAPGGAASRLEYRKNTGAWVTYDGSPIDVSPADTIEARNLAIDTTNYSDGPYNTSRYYRLIGSLSGNSTGTWGNATGGPNLLTDTNNGPSQSTFKHGNTKLDLGNGEFLDAGTENVLEFKRQPYNNITPGEWFPLGDMLMLNGTTFYESEADGVTLSINLNLITPPQTGVVHVNLGLISTENTSDRTASADIVELRNPTTDFTFTVEGITYRLELSWRTLDPGAGISQGNQFLVYEGSSARAELRGRFVPNQ